MSKYKYKDSYNQKNYKTEFIISCFRLPKSRHKEIPWAKEIKIMNSLVDKCSNPKFWFHARPEFQLPSLAWFLTRDGRRYLNEKYATFNLELKKEVKEEIKLDEKKLGSDEPLIPKKPKTIMDFIKNK